MGTADCTTAAFLGTFLRLWVCLTWQIQPPCPPQAAAANGRPPQKRLDFWPFLARFPPRWDSVRFSSVAQLCPILCDPITAACHASLSITNSRSLLKLVSIESVMPTTIFCPSLFLPPSIFPSIRIFSNELVLHIRWPKYWSCSFSISPSNEYSGVISFRID